MSHQDTTAQCLRYVFGHASFRDGQRPIVDDVIADHDCFVLLPTGGGKSLCYQLPAVLSCGVTVVVCPLLALMQDQVQALCNGSPRADPGLRGVPATYLSSVAPPGHAEAVYADLARGPMPYTKCLYVTPEQLSSSSRLRSMLQQLAHARPRMLARIVVDEAHCVSQVPHAQCGPLPIARRASSPACAQSCDLRSSRCARPRGHALRRVSRCVLCAAWCPIHRLVVCPPRRVAVGARLPA